MEIQEVHVNAGFFFCRDFYVFSRGSVCLYMRRIGQDGFSIHQALFYTLQNNLLKQAPKQVRPMETPAPVLGYGRMVRNTFLQIQT